LWMPCPLMTQTRKAPSDDPPSDAFLENVAKTNVLPT
jgi:hypothetical protein